MKRFIVIIVAAVIAAISINNAVAADWQEYDDPVPTKVMVRVLSHGAKAMNPNTGALVIIRDARTNDILGKGAVEGSTGDTKALMNAAYPRVSGMAGLLKGQKGMVPKDGGCDTHTASDDAAVYATTLKLSKPTQVVIEVRGPMMPHHAGATAVTTTWLFPGEDVTGEGIVMELRGLIVDVDATLKEAELNVESLKEGIDLPFFMRMMCGCPIAPRSAGLPWEAEDFKINVQAYYKGKLYHEETTTSDKQFVAVSQFMSRLPLPDGLPEGPFKREQVLVRVMASQPKMNNFGMDEFSVFLSR